MLREVVLEVGAEGGSLTLVRQRNANESWRFRMIRNELAAYEALSEEDRNGIDFYSETEYVRSLDEGLKLLDKYQWFNLYPLEVHPEFFYAVLREVRKRGGQSAELRWRQMLRQEKPLLDLRQLAQEFINNELHCDSAETDADNRVINAISDRERDPEDRNKSLLEWLDLYSVLRGLRTDTRVAIAGQIIAFADERQQRSLQRDKDQIFSEFNHLKDRISTVTQRQVISLASKALWCCCYPDDVPMFSRNAISALKLISRLCHLTPEPKQPEYDSFVDVWLQVYNEIEPVITSADLSYCPYKVRVLDRLLWYLGQTSFYGEAN